MVLLAKRMRQLLKFRLTLNDSADIGLAHSALFARAITFEEFQDWLYFVVEHADDPPHFIFDLIDWDRSVDTHINQVIGWWPSTGVETDLDALLGVGFVRNLCDSCDSMSREDAISALKSNADVLKRLRILMPFVDWDSEVPRHTF